MLDILQKSIFQNPSNDSVVIFGYLPCEVSFRIHQMILWLDAALDAKRLLVLQKEILGFIANFGC